MSILQIVFILLPLFAVLIYGGIRLRNVVKGVKIATVPGALLVFVCFTRYMVYFTAFALSLGVVAQLLGSSSNFSTFSHRFEIQFDDPVYSISDVTGMTSNVAEIKNLIGSVDLVGSNWIVIAITVTGLASIIVLLHWMLFYAEQVLRSLYIRVPFTLENATHTRKISILMLCFWFVYSVYQVVMTLYLQSTLEVEGVRLQMVSIPLFNSLFLAGLIFVMSEVFRVGYELKEDLSLTV